MVRNGIENIIKDHKIKWDCGLEEYLEDGLPAKSLRRQEVPEPKAVPRAVELLPQPRRQERIVECRGRYSAVEGSGEIGEKVVLHLQVGHHGKD